MNIDMEIISKFSSCKDKTTMIMDVPTEHVKLIIDKQKTVIVQKKIPNMDVQSSSIYRKEHPKVYLYNKYYGVFGECYCELSFDNIDNINKNFFKYVSNYTRNMYKNDPEGNIDELKSLVDLSGTCMQYDEFINYIGTSKYIFFIIKELIIYDLPLTIDDFYICYNGKNGIFKPNENYKAPRGWCYALKK